MSLSEAERAVRADEDALAARDDGAYEEGLGGGGVAEDGCGGVVCWELLAGVFPSLS